MSAKKGFSKKELADQNAKVAELAKEEGKLVSAIERGEKKLAEDREKLKETQRARAAENVALEQMIQKGIKAAAKGDTDQRAALIAALLMGVDGEADDAQTQMQLEPEAGRKTSSGTESASAPPAVQTPSIPSTPAQAEPPVIPPVASSDDDDQNEAA